MLLLFLGFSVILSGFVAYAADIIARKVGRKHLRLFGLRPKTTALIVAVGAGMLISLVSMIAFGLVNRQSLRTIAQADQLRLELRELREELLPLRVTIESTRGELNQVRGERDEAARQVRTLQASREAAVSERDAAVIEADLARQERDAATSARDDANIAREAARREVLALQARAAELDRKARLSERALASTRAQAAELRVSLGSLQGQVDRLEAARAEAESRASRAQEEALASRAQAERLSAAAADAAGRASEAQAQVQTLSRQASTLEKQLQDLQARSRQLVSESRALTADRDRLRRERDAAQQEARAQLAVRDSLLNDNAELRAGLEVAQADRVRLQGDVARVATELSALRTGDTVYTKGDLVYKQVVASVHNLPDLLTGAAQQAEARGAAGNPAVVVPSDVLSRLQDRLRGLNTGTLVVLRAATNVVEGFPVELYADAYPNRLLYRRNQVIREGTLRPALGLEQSRAQLLDLVSDVVRELHESGVPLENIRDGGLSPADTLTFLSALASRQDARVGIAARSDVRPGNEVELYPILRR